MHKRPMATNSFSIYVFTDKKPAADRLFKELLSGGQLKMPISDTFWGSYYGMCEDNSDKLEDKL